MGRIKISTMLLNTLICGEIGRISRVDNFIVELEVLLAKMMSSFDSCQVLISCQVLPMPPKLYMNHRLRYKNIAYNAAEFTR